MVEGGPARATRAAKKADAEKENEEVANQPTRPSAGELQAALLHVNQMLSLLDLPLAQGRPCRQPPSMHEGLMYSLNDLLIPLNSLMRIPYSTEQNLAAAIGAQNNAGSTSTHDLGLYESNATGIAHVLEQLNSLMHESLPGCSDGDTAVQVVERQLAQDPLSPTEVREVLLRMRQKRRRLTDMPANQSGKGRSTKQSPGSTLRSPLYPMPTALHFASLTPWIEECEASAKGQSVQEALGALVQSFNETISVRCRNEAEALRSPSRDIGQHLPMQRVRARLVSWSDGAGEIQVELRDIALVTIGLQGVDDGAHVARINLFAPSESDDDERRGVSGSLLPSRFARYNEIADHLLIYALERQRSTSYLSALGHALEQVAALRTVFDPLPVPESLVSPIPARVEVGTLAQDKTMDHTKCIVWKWCCVLQPDAPAPQGEWCAYSPRLM